MHFCNNRSAGFSISNCVLLKFRLFEKHTKFEKNLPYGFDKSADLLSKRQNHKVDFFFQTMYASQNVLTLKER